MHHHLRSPSSTGTFVFLCDSSLYNCDTDKPTTRRSTEAIRLDESRARKPRIHQRHSFLLYLHRETRWLKQSISTVDHILLTVLPSIPLILPDAMHCTNRSSPF